MLIETPCWGLHGTKKSHLHQRYNRSVEEEEGAEFRLIVVQATAHFLRGYRGLSVSAVVHRQLLFHSLQL